MPRQLNPDITSREGEVEIVYPGASPEKVEMLVTRPVEERLREIDDVEEIDSDSVEGVSYVDAEFADTANIAEVQREVREKVAAVAVTLPENVENPEVEFSDLETAQMILGLASPKRTRMELEDLAKALRQRLLSLPEVGRVEIEGVPEEQVKILIDPKRLSQYRLPLTTVLEAVAKRNVKVPSGTIRIEGTKMLLSTSGTYRSIAEIEATPIGVNPEGHAIYLRDVAQVVRELEDNAPFVNINGKPGVVLAVFMKKKRNVEWMGRSVREEIAINRTEFPSDVETVILSDEPTYVSEQLSNLNNSLFIGMICVIIVMFVVMGGRNAFIAGATIPLSIIIAIGGLSVLDIPLHRVTIMGLVISLGMVVDNTIVVSDNIARLYREGMPIRDAVVNGTSQVAAAITSGTLTTLAAFLPLIFTSGTVGDYIRAIPFAVAFTILTSLLIAVLVTPLMCLRVLKNVRKRRVLFTENSRFMALYDRLLSTAFRRPYVTLALTLLLLGSSILVWLSLGQEMFPTATRSQFYIEINATQGTEIEKTTKLARQISKRLEQQPEVMDYATFVGTRSPRFFYNVGGPRRASNYCQILVNTRPPSTDPSYRTMSKLVSDLKRALEREIVGADVYVEELEEGWTEPSNIRINIQGDDLKTLRRLAAEAKRLMGDVPGVVNIFDSFGQDAFQLDIKVDEQRANLLGIAHADIARTLRAVMSGEVATTFEEHDKELDVVVMVPKESRSQLDDLRHITFTSSISGERIPFSEVATFEPGWTPSRIKRWQGQRMVTVYARTEGVLVSDALAEIRQKIDNMPRPQGCRISYRGELRELKKSFVSMGRAAIVAALLIYLILVAEFNSLIQPLIIGLTLPLAFIGAAWGLFITQNPVGFTAVFGAVSLTGIVVNNAIVLLDFTNRARAAGSDVKSALREAGHKRMRAVLMTTVTTAAGLLPLSLSGDEMWEPLGFAIIFGLTSSTILTLVVIPVIYMLLERDRDTIPAESSAS